MNVTAHQEKEENEETKKGQERGRRKGKRKRENRRPILKLCSAPLRSFRGQHSGKTKGECLG